MKKSKGVAILLAVLLVLAGLSYYASIILSSTGKGEDKNIKLGLDLAGGVSITYQVESENPTSEQMKDTIYKLQKRVEGYSTEASVYQEGDDRITVEIPGVKDDTCDTRKGKCNFKKINNCNYHCSINSKCYGCCHTGNPVVSNHEYRNQGKTDCCCL